jgi:hypothetical protein
MTLRELLKDRILSCMTEEDLAQNMTSAQELELLSDLDLFELYEDHVMKALL